MVKEAQAKYLTTGKEKQDVLEKDFCPDGYKLTEVGALPEGWGLKNLGELATVSSGGTPSRKVETYWNGDIPWVTTTQIDFGIINISEQFITDEGLKRSAAKMYKKGTLLMAMYGQGKTRGKIGVLNIDASINQACAAISLFDKKLLGFVLFYLSSQYDLIRGLSNSGGQENLNSAIIKSIQIPIPSDEEQTAIANALSDVDTLIASLEKLIAKKQAIKTATMQKLLTGKKRLPAFSHHPDGQAKGTKQSELGEIPEDWEVKRLDDAAEFINGRAYSLHEWETNGTPVIRLQNLTGRGNDYYYLNPARIIPNKPEKSLLNNDIISYS